MVRSPAPSADVIDPARLFAFVEHRWEDEILPVLSEYITIPAKSPVFDPHWREHGHLERAVSLLAGWCERRAIGGLPLGPDSNPHGPNEYVHVPTAMKVTACVAQVLADHHRRGER